MSAAGAVRVLDYAHGVGGRIFDLPAYYQDAIADAMRGLHPATATRQVQLVMASDGYLGSEHPLIRGLDVNGLRELHRQLAAAAYQTRRRREANCGAGR